MTRGCDLVVTQTQRLTAEHQTLLSQTESKGDVPNTLDREYITATESFNDWGGGRGCHIFVPVLGGDGTKIAPPGDLFNQPLVN